MIHLIPGQHIHLVGIGGAGLSAIARVLLQQGFYISGSDRRQNSQTQALARDGATIYEGHNAHYIEGAELVIVSSAVADDHVEVTAARAKGVPVYKRQDVIADIMSGQQSIAVSGTHGKTTTTAMITHILIETGQRPSYIIGGTLRTTGQNADIGTGRAFVIEADEYDHMFHGLRPDVAVVTSVEWDHPDFFATPNDMVRAFMHFVSLLPPEGTLIACADDTTALIFAENRLVAGLPVISYGVSYPGADWRAVNVRVAANRQTMFEVIVERRVRGTVRLQIPGRHNILNALAALAAADTQGVPFQDAAAALSTYAGTARRFDVRGEVDGVVVVDDYAHHPTAISATLEAAKQRYPERKLWVVWEPHTYSRTQALWDAYLMAFEAADIVLVTDIYGAREQPISGVNSRLLVDAFTRPHVFYTPTRADTVEFLEKAVHPAAAILILSAGEAPLIGADYLRRRYDKMVRAGHEPTRPNRDNLF